MSQALMTAQDKRWQAEDDARILADSERIKNDAERLTNAKAAAQRMADEEVERAKAMRKVANGSTTPLDSKDGTSTNDKESNGKPSGSGPSQVRQFSIGFGRTN